jgi:hypothetical protein
LIGLMRVALLVLSAYVSKCQQRSAYVSIAYISIYQHMSAYVSIRVALLVLSAYVSIRQHTSAYISIRQHRSKPFGTHHSQPMKHEDTYIAVCGR